MKGLSWIAALVFLLGFPVSIAEAGPAEEKKAGSKGAEPNAAAVDKLDGKLLRELALEHSRSRDALLAAEARLGLVEEKLFKSRLEVSYRGELDPPFSLARIELWLNGGLAYAKDFSNSPSVQMLKLFDAYLPEGTHRIELKVMARGPGDKAKAPPGYIAGSGIRIQLKPESLGSLLFEAEQDGDTTRASEDEQECDWDVEIEARYHSEAKE